MIANSHLDKAKRIEESIRGLNKDDGWELIVEGVYGCAIHYIAAICQSNSGEHLDTHKGLSRFLKERNLPELSNLFKQLDQLRVGNWYGNQKNGDTVELALDVLNQIKVRL